MDIKTLWGFRGDASKLNSDSSVVKAGVTFTDVDEEYGHILIGKGLAERVDSAKAKEHKQATPAVGHKTAPSANKQAKADENK